MFCWDRQHDHASQLPGVLRTVTFAVTDANLDGVGAQSGSATLRIVAYRCPFSDSLVISI